jgi:hypothetical protein
MTRRGASNEFSRYKTSRRLGAAGLALVIGPSMLSVPTLSHVTDSSAKISLHTPCGIPMRRLATSCP